MAIVQIKECEDLKGTTNQRSSYKQKQIGGKFGLILEEKKRGWYKVRFFGDSGNTSVRSSEIKQIINKKGDD